MYIHIHSHTYAAQEASWKRVIEPVYPLLSDWCHWLWTKEFSHFHPFEWASVDIRWSSVAGFDTRWISRVFSCGIYVYMYMYMLHAHMYTYVYVYTYIYIYLAALLRKHPTTWLLRVTLRKFAACQVERGIWREMKGSSPEGVAVEKTAGINAHWCVHAYRDGAGHVTGRTVAERDVMEIDCRRVVCCHGPSHTLHTHTQHTHRHPHKPTHAHTHRYMYEYM